MGGLSIWHWLIVLIVVMLLFGTGKVSTLMGDFAKGIKSFKKNMNEEDASMEATASPASASIPPPPTTVPPSPNFPNPTVVADAGVAAPHAAERR